MFSNNAIGFSPNRSGFGGGGMGAGNMDFSGLASLISGLSGNSDKPYEVAGNTLEDYFNQAKKYQNPFFNAGKRALPKFNEWLNGMKDPSQFINNLMGKYQESPYAKFQQEQATRAAINQGSASGLTGSTPLTQFAQQNARDISSQDMNQWLQNVLGINTQYGAGQQGIMQGGQHAGDIMAQLLNQMGENMAGLRYGEQAGRNQDRSNTIGGIFDIVKNGLFG